MEQMFSLFSTTEWVVLASVFFLFILQLVYCFGANGRVAFYKLSKQSRTDDRPPVSIILSARNEYETLQYTLPKILSQVYPAYEVIVVNDCSEDDSETLLASMQKDHSHLVYRNIVKDDVFTHSKKMALGVGIKAAQYDLCLLIDADCYPLSEHWLAGMQQFFTSTKDVVIGYTCLNAKKNARWIRADRFMQALHYLGRALAHRPYMGFWSNLAFRKQLFFDNKGFDMRITKNLRGDCLFVNQIATESNTAVAVAVDTTTVSTLKITTSMWFLQRCEELRTFALFSNGPRYPALLESILRLCYYAAMAVAFVFFYNSLEILPGLIVLEVLRITALSIVFVKSLRKLGEKGLWFPLLFWNFVYPFVHLILIIASKFPYKQRT